MHELRDMRPLVKLMTKQESQATIERLRTPSVTQEITFLRRAFILRAHQLGISDTNISHMTGITRQRIHQIFINLRPDLHDLIEPLGRPAKQEQVQAIVDVVRSVNVLERWCESEEFRFAMMRLVGYRL